MNLDIKQVNFGETILELQRKKKALREEKIIIERQIEVIEQTIQSLVFLGNPQSKMPLPRNISELGVQHPVRSIFRRSYPVYLVPTDIRVTLLTARGFAR